MSTPKRADTDPNVLLRKRDVPASNGESKDVMGQLLAPAPDSHLLSPKRSHNAATVTGADAETMLETLQMERTRNKPFHSSVSLRNIINFTHRRTFNVKDLPQDLQRICSTLSERYGEEYGLLIIFTIRTAVELHRAWHMTLLTNMVLQQLKDNFDLRITWSLGYCKAPNTRSHLPLPPHHSGLPN